MNDYLVHPTPNHNLPKMDALPKTFLQSILAAKWLVRGIQGRPPTSIDDLCLLSYLFLFLKYLLYTLDNGGQEGRRCWQPLLQHDRRAVYRG